MAPTLPPSRLLTTRGAAGWDWEILFGQPSMVLLPGAWSQPASHLHTAAPPALTSQVVWIPQGVGEHWPDTRDTKTVTRTDQSVTLPILVCCLGN